MEVPAILACLSAEEEDGAVLAEAARLAAELAAPLSVVFVYPSGWTGPARAWPGAWHLKADEPQEPLARFAKRNGITHVVLGRNGPGQTLMSSNSAEDR
ncbi:MAG TPA: hypothetical protein DCM05_00395 [Elusimicrobia bacterium]|nr:hypothetical protein [Elusimicrobiota bacterium]